MENPEKEEESGVDCFFLQLNSPLVKKLRAGSLRASGSRWPVEEAERGLKLLRESIC